MKGKQLSCSDLTVFPIIATIIGEWPRYLQRMENTLGHGPSRKTVVRVEMPLKTVATYVWRNIN